LETKVRLFEKKLTDFSSTSHLKGVTPRGYTYLKHTISSDETFKFGSRISDV
jgi:hypothetical protein